MKVLSLTVCFLIFVNTQYRPTVAGKLTPCFNGGKCPDDQYCDELYCQDCEALCKINKEECSYKASCNNIYRALHYSTSTEMLETNSTAHQSKQGPVKIILLPVTVVGLVVSVILIILVYVRLKGSRNAPEHPSELDTSSGSSSLATKETEEPLCQNPNEPPKKVSTGTGNGYQSLLQDNPA